LPAGQAWSTGNEVIPLIHGATYFSELLTRVSGMRASDLLAFTDWRGDPDERLSADGTTVAELLRDAAGRGVIVRGLIWRSHWDRFQFSGEENRHLGVDINAAGGQCLLDMRVRAGGSHHMKMVVLRHAGRPSLDVAFVGGSTCATAGATTPVTAVTRSASRWPPSTESGRPGTTFRP